MPSAHLIDREFRIQKALQKRVPVPEMIDYVKAGVLDTDFYLMNYINGRIFTDANLDKVPPAARRQIHEELIRVLAQIQSVHLKDAQLEDYGKPGMYSRFFLLQTIFGQLFATQLGTMVQKLRIVANTWLARP